MPSPPPPQYQIALPPPHPRVILLEVKGYKTGCPQPGQRLAYISRLSYVFFVMFFLLPSTKYTRRIRLSEVRSTGLTVSVYQGQESAIRADGFILGIGRFDSTKFVVNNWFMAGSLLMKQSGQKTKSCVRLKACLKIIYGIFFWIFSRPCTSS